MATAAANLKKARPKAQQAQAVRDERVVATVGKMTADGVGQKLAAARAEVAKKLTEVHAAVDEALAQLADTNRAVELKRAELKTLYDIEAAAVELDDVRRAAAEAREEMARDRAAWQAEQADLQESARKARAREEEDYQYQTRLARRNNEAEFKARLDADLAKVAAREQAVKAAEAELAALRLEKAQAPEDVKAAVAKAEAVLSNVLKKDYEHKAQLAEAARAHADALAQQEKKALEAAKEALQKENERLRAEADKVRADAKELAGKALDAKPAPVPVFTQLGPAEELRVPGRGK